jgi:Lon protease-like protein
VIELPRTVPLFPLPNVVLFPQMPLPLHIFEPRYRKMVEDARRGHEIIGMVLLQPGWEPRYYGRPPVFPIGCAGRMEQCEALPDGRYNILLRGLTRFEIVNESADEPYRVARVQARPEQGSQAPEELEALRARLIGTIEKASEQEAIVLHGGLPPDTFINALSQSLDLTPLEKQSLLDCDAMLDRGQRLIEILEFKDLERRSSRGGSPRIH